MRKAVGTSECHHYDGSAPTLKLWAHHYDGSCDEQF